MKKTPSLFFIILLFLVPSCMKDEQAYTTFTGDMVYSFLQKDSTYSEFVRILDNAGLKGMLSAYGDYTCLAPTNNALRTYYSEHGKHFTFDSLSQGEVDSLARAHITPNRYHTYDLTSGVMPITNMNYHYVEVQFDSLVGGIRFNGLSRIVSKNNDVYNGVVHGINRVLKQPIAFIGDLMKQNPAISIFTEALYLTHLSDSVSDLADNRVNAPKAYVLLSETDRYLFAPQRKFGFTVFVEDNQVLKANGIHSIQDLIARAKELYPQSDAYDNDYTNRNNSLNKFIAYHLINKAIYANRFFYKRNAIKGYTPDEFHETMMPNRLIKFSNINSEITLNTGTNVSTRVILMDNQRTLNGTYHLLDHLLVYTDNVERMLQNTRIRFDVSSLFPELTNNNLRGTEYKVENSMFVANHFELDQSYLSNFKMSGHSRIAYVSGLQDASVLNRYQGDMMITWGEFDISVRLLPVPPGTYELRFGFSSGFPKYIQVYVDNKPVGVPQYFINFDMNDGLGYLRDEQTSDNGVKNDQQLRDKGYMKAPTTFWGLSDSVPRTQIPARQSRMAVRKIIGVFSLTDYKAMTIRFKALGSGSYGNFFIDYFELVPKSIYNPPGDEKETRD